MLLAVTALRRTYRNRQNDPNLRYFLRSQFKEPGNIIAFGEFCFAHHMKVLSPEFHYELMELANTPGNVGVAAPRGHAKSTIVNLVYLAWVIVNEQYHFILPISDTLGQSIEFVNTLKTELAGNPMLRYIYGNLVGSVWGNGLFETNTGIKVMARGYGMKIRGLKYRQYRPQLLVFDDLENDESVQSADQREKLKSWFTLAALPAMAKDGRAIVVGTILHGDSLLTNIVNKRGEFSGWTTAIFKAINQAADGRMYALWPDMYSLEELVAMRDDPNNPKYIGSLAFAQEYQNEPIDEKDAIIKRSWIKRCDHLPVDVKSRAFFCDPAISKSDAADFFAKLACVTDGDNLYMYRISNEKLSFQEGTDSIYQWNRDEKPNYIGIESVQFQQAYISATKGLPIIELMPDKDKRRRLLAVSRFFESGNVYILNNIANADLLIDQLTHFPSLKHDDLVDVVSYAIDKMLVKRVGTYGATVPGSQGRGFTADMEETTY